MRAAFAFAHQFCAVRARVCLRNMRTRPPIAAMINAACPRHVTQHSNARNASPCAGSSRSVAAAAAAGGAALQQAHTRNLCHYSNDPPGALGLGTGIDVTTTATTTTQKYIAQAMSAKSVSSGHSNTRHANDKSKLMKVYLRACAGENVTKKTALRINPAQCLRAPHVRGTQTCTHCEREKEEKERN